MLRRGPNISWSFLSSKTFSHMLSYNCGSSRKSRISILIWFFPFQWAKYSLPYFAINKILHHRNKNDSNLFEFLPRFKRRKEKRVFKSFIMRIHSLPTSSHIRFHKQLVLYIRMVFCRFIGVIFYYSYIRYKSCIVERKIWRMIRKIR